MKNLLCFIVLMGCVRFTPAYAQEQQQKKGCWNQMKSFLVHAKETNFHRNLVLTLYAGGIQAVIYGNHLNKPWINSVIATLLSGGCGMWLGSFKISKEEFMQALPVCYWGTIGAVAGRYGGAWLGLSEEQTSLLATLGACAGGGAGYIAYRNKFGNCENSETNDKYE